MEVLGASSEISSVILGPTSLWEALQTEIRGPYTHSPQDPIPLALTIRGSLALWMPCGVSPCLDSVNEKFFMILISILTNKGLGRRGVVGGLGGVLHYCTVKVNLGDVDATFRISQGAIHGCIQQCRRDNLSVRELLTVPRDRMVSVFISNISHSQAPSPHRRRLSTLLPSCLGQLDHGNIAIGSLCRRCTDGCPSKCDRADFGEQVHRCGLRMGTVKRIRRLTNSRVCVSFTKSGLRMMSRLANRIRAPRAFITILPYDRVACYRTI